MAKNQNQTPTKAGTRSEYEIRNGLVSRKELMGYITDYLDELDDMEFHGLYRMLWTLSSRKLIIETTERNKEV